MSRDLSTTFLFPGQGAQKLGMAIDLVDRYPRARAVFETGREILGRDFLAICRDGPEEELSSTRVSQPAIFLHSMAVLEVLGDRFGVAAPFCRAGTARATAGLSLGEYSALVFAGSLEFEDALRIVGRRGEWMQEACDAAPGAMVSIMGLAAEAVEDVVESLRAAGHRVNVANYNSDEQTVVSGASDDIGVATARLKEAGARRATPLRVAGAYHSPLMASATRKLEPLLREVRIRAPLVAFYGNVRGALLSDPEEIRDGLIRQVEGSVRWKQIARALVDGGVTKAFEVGPGTVLRGLMRNVSRDVEVTPVGTCDDIESIAT